MGARERAAAEGLRAKYARMFRVPKCDVITEEFIDDRDREDVMVYAPHWDAPVWTVGTLSGWKAKP